LTEEGAVEIRWASTDIVDRGEGNEDPWLIE
jgi:hypothetical protein